MAPERVEETRHAVEATWRDAEVKSHAIDEPAQHLFDDGEGRVPLAEFFDGVDLAAGDIMAVVGAENTVDLVEQIATCRRALGLGALLEENEVIHVHIGEG